MSFVRARLQHVQRKFLLRPNAAQTWPTLVSRAQPIHSEGFSLLCHSADLRSQARQHVQQSFHKPGNRTKREGSGTFSAEQVDMASHSLAARHSGKALAHKGQIAGANVTSKALTPPGVDKLFNLRATSEYGNYMVGHELKPPPGNGI